MTYDHRVQCPRVRLGVITQDILNIFCFIFSFMKSFIFKEHVLLWIDFLSVTSYCRVQCPRVGSKCRTFFRFFLAFYRLCNRSYLNDR